MGETPSSGRTDPPVLHGCSDSVDSCSSGILFELDGDVRPARRQPKAVTQPNRLSRMSDAEEQALVEAAVKRFSKVRPTESAGATGPVYAAPRRWLARQTRPQQGMAETLYGATSLFGVQLWSLGVPWRPTALWAGLAGLLAVGGLPVQEQWHSVLLMLLLVDLLWGGIWRLAGGRSHLLPIPDPVSRSPFWLPYLQPDSPAARFFSPAQGEFWPLLLRVGLPSVLLAVGVAAVLGLTALLFTAALMLVTLAGWTVRHANGSGSGLLASMATIGLPWLLVMQQRVPSAGELLSPLFWGLPLCWLLHHWGELQLLGNSRDPVGWGLLAVGELGICLVLIGLRVPLWLAGIVLLLLPTWLLLLQGRPVGQRMQPLWLAALLLSALAVGQVV